MKEQMNVANDASAQSRAGEAGANLTVGLGGTTGTSSPNYMVVGVCGACGGQVVTNTITTTGTDIYKREWCLQCEKTAKPPGLPVRKMS